jgi:dTMP kinase
MSGTADKFAGRFIVLDGPDGSGKSTQLKMLGSWLRSEGASVVETHDPGGTVIGDKIRRILLDRDHNEMTIGCEMLLYMASRTQLMGEVIAPAIDAGKCVLCDRWVSSTVAYQAEEGALSPMDIVAIYEIALRSVKPDLTVILDIPAEVGLSRIARQADRMEAKGVEFHRKVRKAFLDQARGEPDRFLVVDAAGGREEVNERLRKSLLERGFVR